MHSCGFHRWKFGSFLWDFPHTLAIDVWDDIYLSRYFLMRLSISSNGCNSSNLTDLSTHENYIDLAAGLVQCAETIDMLQKDLKNKKFLYILRGAYKLYNTKYSFLWPMFALKVVIFEVICWLKTRPLSFSMMFLQSNWVIKRVQH